MATSYYEPGAGRAGRVQDLFADIASRYDLINDVQSFGLHRFWKARLVRLAAVGAGAKALDVCCGTGDIALALRERGAEVIGVDFSLPMLRIAGKRAASLGSRGAEDVARAPAFLRGDTQRLPFADNTFDAVTVGYGLRNLARWEEGLEEMWRVARPDGRLLVLDFGKPPSAIWRAIYFGYLGRVAPLFGKLFCRNAPAYAYILESLQKYPAQEGVAARMRALGCREVRVMNLAGGAMSINAAVKQAA